MGNFWTGCRIWLAGIVLAALAGCLDVAPADKPQTRAEAARFLNQATFGPDEASITRLMAIGYEAWIDEQFALKPAFTYRSFMARRDEEIKADAPGSLTAKAGPDQVLEAFYTRALTDAAQLRARLSFALSEIFVVSLADEALNKTAPEMVAGYMDTLDSGLDGSYRALLEAITKSPAMGQYLTYRGNTREMPEVGHFPDENYAREVMQLFSIGLYELNQDGTPRLDGQGRPVETYGNDDIKGLAKVFTGWSNYRGPAYASQPEALCLSWAPNCRDPEGFYHPMVPYPAYHSVSEKRFLGLTIPAQDTPDPEASLSLALDRLASHPNTAPFISKQLIQRLVTSNPTPAYVARVATRFAETGGNLREVTKAILLDEEARGAATLAAPEQGKLREPVLRLTALLRAFRLNGATLNESQTRGRIDRVAIGNTSDAATSWGQTPLWSPSVFNFFRPGYTPPMSQTARMKLVAPEMQLVHETSVAGYVNAVLDLLSAGIGPVSDGRRNVLLDLSEQEALASDAEALVQHLSDRLLGGTISQGLRQMVTQAVNQIAVTQDDGRGTVDQAALSRRVWTAITMLAVSPEFLITH
jgi:uncharacterized protein (DUF1800 family)